MPEHRIDLPTVAANEDRLPARVPLVPERSDFLEGDAPAASKVEAFLARALEATGTDAPTTAGALIPWICDALLSNHSVKAYGRDLMDFLRHMQAHGVDPLEVTADHVKLYKRALLEADGPRRPSQGGSRSSAAPTTSLRPRGSSPGRRPRTSVRSRPPASRRTPRRPSPRSRRSRCWRRSPPTPCRESGTWR